MCVRERMQMSRAAYSPTDSSLEVEDGDFKVGQIMLTYKTKSCDFSAVVTSNRKSECTLIFFFLPTMVRTF